MVIKKITFWRLLINLSWFDPFNKDSRHWKVGVWCISTIIRSWSQYCFIDQLLILGILIKWEYMDVWSILIFPKKKHPANYSITLLNPLVRKYSQFSARGRKGEIVPVMEPTRISWRWTGAFLRGSFKQHVIFSSRYLEDFHPNGWPNTTSCTPSN